MKTILSISVLLAAAGAVVFSSLGTAQVGIKIGQPPEQAVETTEVKSLQLSHAIDGLAFAPSGDALLVQTKSRGKDKARSLLRCEIANAKSTEIHSTTDVMYGPVISPDGKTVYLGQWRTGPDRRCELLSFDTTEAGFRRKLPAASPSGLGLQITSDPTALGVSSDGILVACGTKLVDNKFLHGGHIGGEVCVWDTSKGEALWRNRTTHTNIVRAIVFSPDGKQLFSAGADSLIRIWDARTGELEGTLVGTLWEGVANMAISPDGRFLATGGQGLEEGGRVRVWDLSEQQTIHLFQPYSPESLVHVTFCGDGTLIAAGVEKSYVGADGAKPRFEVCGWLPETFVAFGLVGNGDGWLRALAAAPTKHRVAVGTWDGEILQFDFQSSNE